MLSRDPPAVQELKKELSALRKQWSDRERVNLVLVKENDNLVKHNEELRQENDMATNEMQDLIAELDDVHEESMDLRQEVKALEKERDEFEVHYHYHSEARQRQQTTSSGEEQKLNHRFTPVETTTTTTTSPGVVNSTTGVALGLPNVGDCQSVISQASHGTVLSGNGSVASLSQEDNGTNTNNNGIGATVTAASLSPSSPNTQHAQAHAHAGLHMQTFNAENQHEHYKYQMKHRLSLAQQEKTQIHTELDRIRKERDDLIEIVMKSHTEKKKLVKRVNKSTYQANHFEWLAREIQDLSEDTTHFVHSTLRESYLKCENTGEQQRNMRHRPRMCYSCNRPHDNDNNFNFDNHSSSTPNSPQPQQSWSARTNNPQDVPPFNTPRQPQNKTARPRTSGDEILSNFNNTFVPVPLPPGVPAVSSLILNPPMPPKEHKPHTEDDACPPPPPPSTGYEYLIGDDDAAIISDREAEPKFGSRFSVLAKPRMLGARSTSMVQRIASNPRTSSFFGGFGQSMRSVTTGSTKVPGDLTMPSTSMHSSNKSCDRLPRLEEDDMIVPEHNQRSQSVVELLRHPPTLLEGLSFRQENEVDNIEDDAVTLLEPFQARNHHEDDRAGCIGSLDLKLSLKLSPPHCQRTHIQSAPGSRRTSMSSCISIAEEKLVGR
jgi:DNA-directed RNA polymerase subunit H (RpoH/RPB5)